MTTDRDTFILPAGGAVLTSLLLASCGGSSSPTTPPVAPAPLLTAPVQNVTDSSYFVLQQNILPNFSSYYSSFGNYGGGLLFTNTVTTTINGQPSIIFFIHKTQASVGSLVNAPVDNIEIILQKQADGRFIDVTAQLLGNSPFKLNGQAGDAVAVKTNLTGSNNPTILIAGNAEDGRAINVLGSADKVVSQIQIPQVDGTYKTLNIGTPVFGGKGSMSVIGDNFYIGDFQRIEANWHSNGNIGKYYQPFYRYDSNSASFVNAGTAPTDAYGYEFINNNTMFTVATHFTSNTSGPSGYAFALASKVGSDWTFGNYVVPFTTVNLSYVDSGNRLTSTAENYHYGIVIDGVNVYNALFSVQGQADLIKDGKNEIVTGINAAYVPTLRSDGRAYEVDFKAYTKLQFWNVVDNKITQADITLHGENTAINQGNLQLTDVNNDGLIDIVINSWNDTGAPEVYLNTGAGDMYHVDSFFFPTSNMGYTGAVLADLNGDNIADLIYQPWGVKESNSSAQPLIYYGSKPLTVNENITVADRHNSMQISTWSGNDVIYDKNSAGKTIIDAGAGKDIAMYSGNKADYNIVFNSDGSVKVSSATMDDLLKNFEELHFADQTVMLQQTKVAAVTETIFSLPDNWQLPFSTHSDYWMFG